MNTTIERVPQILGIVVLDLLYTAGRLSGGMDGAKQG